MTDTQSQKDTYETLIFYAGVMKYLTEGIDELTRFQAVQPQMTDEMRNTLFMLISNRIAMKRQKILGVAPVLQPYHRLNPLFYHLSHTEDLYYTTEDVLLVSKLVTQQISPAYEERLTRQRDAIAAEMTQRTKAKARDPAFEARSKEYKIRENESKKQIFTRTTLNQISHRHLTELTPIERKALMGTPARNDILAVLNLFNERIPGGIRVEIFEKSSTPAEISVAPLYNFDMSMEGTLDRAINYTLDYTKELARLDKLRRQNRRDKDIARQYTEISTNPFRTLRKKFDEEMDLLRILSHRKGAEKEAQEARENVEKRMAQYAEICEATATATKQVALESREKCAIFVERRE